MVTGTNDDVTDWVYDPATIMENRCGLILAIRDPELETPLYHTCMTHQEGHPGYHQCHCEFTWDVKEGELGAG